MDLSRPAETSLIDAELAFLREKRRTGPRHGPGKALGIVVVDFQRFFMDVPDPLAGDVLRATSLMLDAARARHIPIFFAVMVLDGPSEVNLTWGARHDMTGLFRGAPGTEVHPVVGLRQGDILIEKKHASSFFGTCLHQEIKRLGIDTVLVAGMSTSGCVRATVIDGAALGLRMELVEECVYEPRPISGPIALSEIHDRYGDVITFDEAMQQIDLIAGRG